VTPFSDLSPLRSRAGLGLATLSAVVLLAGCGSSGSSTIGINNQNSGDEALAKATSSSTSTTAPSSPPATTPASATATTPASGPLSTEPHVTPPTSPAPSKLVIHEIIVGTGPEAKAGQSVTVNYVGVLYKGGTEFDASWKRKEPFVFALGKGQVISGWDQGIAGMKVGGRRELIIPAPLAYGANGSPPTIPPNAALIFVVDLLGV
jgi:peptidylprolyl isomerase